MSTNYQPLIVFCVLLLAACDGGQQNDIEPNTKSANFSDADTDYYDPYLEYCLQGTKLDVDPNSLRSDDCILDTEGRNRSDMTDLNANAFFVSVSDYAPLNQAGIKNFSINIKIGKGAPKIKPGIYKTIPYSILSTENKALPEIMVHLSSIRNDNAFGALMTPDIEKFKQSNSSPDLYPDYEIVSATLDIKHTEDIPMNKDEQEEQKFQAKHGMLTGQQYVKGTLTFTIKKFGPDGADFGPETFTFGSRNHWAYFPQPNQ